MDKYIRDQRIETDEWTPFTGLEDPASLPAGDIYVPLDEWLKVRDVLLTRNSRLGVALRNTDDPAVLADDLERLDLIVLEFPKMGDGRAYTQARLLRERHGFKGEIRATGDVLYDQLFYMKRCGINGFKLRGDQDLEKALQAFDVMSVTYQPACDEELPIWRRRR